MRTTSALWSAVQLRFAAVGPRLRGLVLSAALISLGGCMTMVKQAISEVRGAQGEIKPVAPIGSRELNKFKQVEFEPATTTLSRELCPPALAREYDAAAKKLVRQMRPLYAGGSPALRVTTDLQYFQQKGALSQAELLARVKMFDGERQVADMLVKVESNSFRAGDEKALAGAAVTALQGLFEAQTGKKVDTREGGAGES